MENDTEEDGEDVEVELAPASLASAAADSAADIDSADGSADSDNSDEESPSSGCSASKVKSKGFRIGVATASTIAVITAATILIAILVILVLNDGFFGGVGGLEAQADVANKAVIEEDFQPTYYPSSLTDWPTYSPTREEELSFRVESYYGTSSFTEPRDFFLLGGQSNMVGHSTSSESLGAEMNKEDSSQYWFDMKTILEAANRSSEEREAALYDTVYRAHEHYFERAAAEIAGTLARETMQLYEEGLLDNLDSQLDLGSCSFLEPLEQYDDNQRPIVEDTSSGIQPLIPGSNCGRSFGHELLFGRTLELQLAQGNRYEMVKYASGGSVLNEHWLSGEGIFWDGLNSTIHSRQEYGNWKAFVWHQGESSAFLRNGEDQSLSYLGNLTAFVKAVRGEMHSASPGFWECPEAIPVVIVQLGAWPGGAEAERIREAQARFCESDGRSGLVTMGDLSPFYHFDPLSLLISGNRIAKAYDLIRSSQSEYECPGDDQISD